MNLTFPFLGFPSDWSVPNGRHALAIHACDHAGSLIMLASAHAASHTLSCSLWCHAGHAEVKLLPVDVTEHSLELQPSQRACLFASLSE